MNHFHSDEEIEAIALGLVQRTLPKDQWTHAAHFAAALWFLCRYSYEDALPVIRDSIRTYNEAIGGGERLSRDHYAGLLARGGSLSGYSPRSTGSYHLQWIADICYRQVRLDSAPLDEGTTVHARSEEALGRPRPGGIALLKLA